jgi:hypothetical protein
VLFSSHHLAILSTFFSMSTFPSPKYCIDANMILSRHDEEAGAFVLRARDRPASTQPAEEKCKQHHVELTAVQGLDETMPESEPRSAFVRPDAFRGKLP